MRISRPVRAILWQSGSVILKRTVSVRLAWTDGNPLIVRVTFNRRRVNQIKWEISRDLLHACYYESEVGLGDVHIQRLPALGCLSIELESPSGYAEFLFDAEDVWTFLQETLDAVPLGTETVKVPDRIPRFMLAEDG